MPAAYLLDLDGTLYQEGAAIPGAVDLLRRLRRSGVPFRLLTNTTSRSRRLLLDRLGSYGFEVQAGEIFTAVRAGALLARAGGHTRLAPYLAPEALEDLAEFGLAGGTAPADLSPAGLPTALLVGDLGERWTYALLQQAFELLQGGADFIALSRDRYWRRDERLVLDAGPFVAALELAAGRPARVAGKPTAEFFEAALASLNLSPDISRRDIAMVGDDFLTDVQGAQRAGFQGYLVRTGKFRPEALDASGVIPDRVLESVAEL